MFYYNFKTIGLPFHTFNHLVPIAGINKYRKMNLMSIFFTNPDIQECANRLDTPCDQNAECANTVGSFTCSCNSGYTGNGLTCECKCSHRSREEKYLVLLNEKLYRSFAQLCVISMLGISGAVLLDCC